MKTVMIDNTWWMLMSMFTVHYGHGLNEVASDGTMEPMTETTIVCNTHADVVLLLDTSSSVSLEDFDKVVQFVMGILRRADVDSGAFRVGVMTYSTDVHVHFYLNTFHTLEDIKNAVEQIEYIAGSTNTADALQVMRVEMFNTANGNRPGVPDVAIVVTDGLSNYNSQRTIPEATLAHDKGIHIFTIGIGLTETAELEAIATQPYQMNRFLVKTFDELYNIRTEVFTHICEMALLEKHGTSLPQPLPKVTGCKVPSDLVILLDSSTSVAESNFRLMIRFLSAIVQDANIDTGHVRVSLVTFSEDAQVKFLLKDYTQKETLLDALTRVPYIYGGTNTAQGLQLLRTTVFSKVNGDRKDVANVALLMTDGIGSHWIKGGQGDMVYREARRLRNQGVRLVTLGIGKYKGKVKELKKLASQPYKQFVISISDFKQLDSIRKRVQHALCEAATTGSAPGELIPGLTRPTLDGECEGTGDILFVVDSSGSVGLHNFHLLLGFVQDFVHHLDINSGAYRVAMIVYNDEARVIFNLDRNTTKEGIMTEISSVNYTYGATNTAAALQAARTQIFTEAHGARDDAQDLLVLVTDGVSNVRHFDTVPEARLLRNHGVTVAVVGVGLTDTREVEQMSSPPSGKFMKNVPTFDDLSELAHELAVTLCSDENQCARTPCKNGATCLDAFNQYICQCPVGYTGSKCQKSCLTPVDLIFLLDSSGSVGEDNFETLKAFVKGILTELRVEWCGYRVGLAKYGSSALIQWNLNEYNNTADLMFAIDSVGFSYGYTYTAEAIKVTREQMFTEDNGDREEARNIVVLITDGLDNVYSRQRAHEIRLARNAGIFMVPVGVAVNNREELLTLATDENGAFFVEGFNELQNITEGLIHYITEDHDQCDPNPCQNGATCQDRIHDYMCVCPAGWTGKRCTRRCQAESDIALVVDTSSYMGENNLRLVKSFLIKIVDKLALFSDQSRVAVLSFSGHVTVQRYLHQAPATRLDLLGAIHSITYEGGYPYTPAALQTLVKKIFTEENGDRAQATNYAIFITGGLIFSEFQLPLSYKTSNHKLHVFGIGIGLEKDEQRMLDAMSTDGNSFNQPDPQRLHVILNRIVKVLCEENDQCETDPCQNGARCEDGVNGYTCHCNQGYSGHNCERGCPALADVVFLVDSSGSVGRGNFIKLQRFVNSIIDELYISDNHSHVGLATFSTRAQVEFNLNDHTTIEDAKQGVMAALYRFGDTNTAEGLQLIRTRMFRSDKGDRPDIQNILILVTDGVSNIRDWQTIPEAHKCRDAGIHIICVGVGMSVRDEIEAISSFPSQKNTLHVEGFDHLPNISRKLIRTICEDADMCSNNPCMNDGRCLDAVNSYSCQCPDGYSGNNCQRNCNRAMDVAFLLDSSSSVGDRNFKKSLHFVKNITEKMSFLSGKTQVSLMTFSDDVRVEFQLNDYTNKKDILYAMEQSLYDPGGTFLMEALRRVREDVFVPERGDRPSAPNIVVLLVDGVSNILPQETLPEGRKSKRAGIHIISVGVGLEKKTEIRGLASNEDSLFLVDGFNHLESLVDQVLDRLCADTTDAQLMADQPFHNGVHLPQSQLDSNNGGCTEQGDIVFLLDSSGSISQGNFNKMLVFVDQLVRLLSPAEMRMRVGVVTYSDTAQVAFYLNEHLELWQMTKATMAIEPVTGQTNIAVALKAARERMFQQDKGDRPGVPNVAILVTDGFSAVEPQRTLPEAELARKQGVLLYAVGIALSDTHELRLITNSWKHVFATKSFHSLTEIAKSLRDVICHSISTVDTLDKADQCVSSPCKNAGLCVDGDYKYTCRCIPGYRGVNCEIPPSPAVWAKGLCDQQIDLVLLLDSSISLRKSGFHSILNFADLVIRGLGVGEDVARVGLVTFDTLPHVQFHLKEYTSDEWALSYALLSVNYHPGHTNIPDAIRLARTQMFTTSNGDRPHVANWVLLVTDGVSNVNRGLTRREAEAAKREGIRFLVVGIGLTDNEEFRYLTKRRQHTFMSSDMTSLQALAPDVIKAVCQRTSG